MIMGIDFGSLFIGLAFMAIGWWVQSRLRSKFKHYSQIHLSKDLTGGEIARLMLADHGIRDVQVISTPGELSDHYNPANKTVNLSEAVYHGRNAAATAVAAHECGHAVQHATAYSMLGLRSALVPVQNISSSILNFLMIAGMFGGYLMHNWNTIILLYIACYAGLSLFALITLPVEFDASRRALAWIKSRNIVTSSEHYMASDSLKWAALTYVVSALASITMLVYLVLRFMGNREE